MSGGLLKDELAPALRVIKQLGGSIVFTDDEGEEFVIARRQDVESRPKETQLEFPSARVVANAIRKNMPGEIDETVVERINRDIALVTGISPKEADEGVEAIQENEDDLSPDYIRPAPPAVRVRFEPIKGDLPPQLQE